MEWARVLIKNQRQEQAVAVPHRQLRQALDVDPFEIALVVGGMRRAVEFMDEGDQIEWISTEYFPVITVFYDSKKLKKPKDPEEIDVAEFAVIRGCKAKGKKISTVPLKKFSVNDPKPASDKMIRELLGLPDDQSTDPDENSDTEEGLDGQITLSL